STLFARLGRRYEKDTALKDMKKSFIMSISAYGIFGLYGCFRTLVNGWSFLDFAPSPAALLFFRKIIGELITAYIEYPVLKKRHGFSSGVPLLDIKVGSRPEEARLERKDRSEMRERIYEIPEGFRDIAVVVPDRGKNFGTIAGAETLVEGIRRQFRGKGLRLRLLVPLPSRRDKELKREYEILRERIDRLNGEAPNSGAPRVTFEAYRTLSKHPGADVVLYYGYTSLNEELNRAKATGLGDREPPHVQAAQLPAKLAFHMAHYAANFETLEKRDLRFVTGKGVVHQILPTADFSRFSAHANLVLNRALTDESRRIKALSKGQVILERKELLGRLGRKDLLDRVETAWAFAYTQDYVSLSAYLDNVSHHIKIFKKKPVTLFVAPGKRLEVEVDRKKGETASDAILKMFRENKVRIPRQLKIVFLERDFRKRQLYNKILLLSGSLTQDGLFGAFPNLLTGDLSISEAIAGRRVFIPDNYSGHPGWGYYVWRDFYPKLLPEFTEKYCRGGMLNLQLPALFEADPEELQEDWEAAIDPVLERHNIVDEIGGNIPGAVTRPAAPRARPRSEVRAGNEIPNISLLNHPDLGEHIRGMIKRREFPVQISSGKWEIQKPRQGPRQQPLNREQLAERMNAWAKAQNVLQNYFMLSANEIFNFQIAAGTTDPSYFKSPHGVAFYMKQRAYYGMSNRAAVLEKKNPVLYEAVIREGWRIRGGKFVDPAAPETEQPEYLSEETLRVVQHEMKQLKSLFDQLASFSRQMCWTYTGSARELLRWNPWIKRGLADELQKLYRAIEDFSRTGVAGPYKKILDKIESHPLLSTELREKLENFSQQAWPAP
ncbi:MAG: hypothetical protein WC552_10220, partial [Candidatus Omnitrophota bacterium]